MCNARGNYEGELDFSYDADDDLIDVPYVTFSAPVRVHLHYEVFEDDSVDVAGKMSFSLKGLCSRCLSETHADFETEVKATFARKAEDDEEYEYQGGVVNLEELLRDTLLVALPSRLVCEPECVLPEWINQDE